MEQNFESQIHHRDCRRYSAEGKVCFYLKQDQIFLNDLLAAAARITYDKQTKLWFESLIHNTSRYEMPMQNEILYQLEDNPEFIGVSVEEMSIENRVMRLERQVADIQSDVDAWIRFRQSVKLMGKEFQRSKE
jgi:hypothetical protein